MSAKSIHRCLVSCVLLFAGGFAQAQIEIPANSNFEYEIPIPNDDNITIAEDGTIIVGGPNNDGDVQVSGFDNDGTLIADNIFPADDYSLSFIGVQDNYGIGDFSYTVTTGGSDPAGDVNVDVEPFDIIESFYLQDLRMAWDEVAMRLRDKNCSINKMTVNRREMPTAVPEGPDGIYGNDDDPSNDDTDVDPSNILLRITIYTLFIHCDDRRNITIDVSVFVKSQFPEPQAETFVSEARVVSFGTSGSKQGRPASTKGTEPPIAAIPVGESVLTLGMQSVTGYLGTEVGGGSAALPTLVWLDGDAMPQEVVQVSGPGAGFGSNLSLCGEPNYEHLWMTWTSASGEAQLAYVEDRNPQVMELGSTNGPTALDCDVWGNAVVAYANGSGSQITLATYGPNGSLRDSESFASAGGFGGMLVDVDMNNNGEVVVGWPNQSGGTTLQPVTIDGVVTIDMSFAGSWNSPFYDGEGFIWDIAQVNGVPTLVLYYFSYRPNNAGRQAWMVGSAPIFNGIATIPAAITEGATFGSAYDPDDVDASSWGEIEVRVGGCGYALMIMRSPSFGDHRYPIQKFTNTPLDLPGLCADGNLGVIKSQTPDQGVAAPKGGGTDGSFTGSWFSPARNFEGFIFEVVNVSGTPTLVVYWFSYSTTGNGRQLWLVGTGEIMGNTANVTLASTSGGRYGPMFDPRDIVASIFGTVTVTFSDCNNAVVMYQVNGGESGSFAIQRLAALPSGAGGTCGS